jgi:hypothetical protein
MRDFPHTLDVRGSHPAGEGVCARMAFELGLLGMGW